MIVRHLMTSDDALKQRLRRVILYLSRKQGAKKAWGKRHSVVFKQHPDFDNQLPGNLGREHQKLWSPFWRKVPCETLKICHAISDVPSSIIIPEEIFQADVEPTLNDSQGAHFQGDKSFYTRWLPDAGFPLCLLHKINGEYLGRTYDSIDNKEIDNAINTIQFPVVLKPSTDSYGGSGVTIVKEPNVLRDLLKVSDNVVVQILARQHPDTKEFHPASLNTVRVYLYRSVRDNRIHILNRAFRTGNGSEVDNVAAGGLVTYVNDTGELNGFALDRYGARYETHPLTDKAFTGELPNVKQLDSLAKAVAHKLFHLRVVGLDLYCNPDGVWNMLEINTKGHSTRFSQYHGYPFFGKFTDEVIAYCLKNHWAYSV